MATVKTVGRSGQIALGKAYARRQVISAGAELIDIKALLDHESISTTQIYTHITYNHPIPVVDGLPVETQYSHR
ncbi:MAG: hypothetical protein HC889_13720 [Synechococcaceae cyanobacterium SM1_2_3]|nr:hypothetical protein [Synechococcaceae cyanobacterium SM1_2_3]